MYAWRFAARRTLNVSNRDTTKLRFRSLVVAKIIRTRRDDRGRERCGKSTVRDVFRFPHGLGRGCMPREIIGGELA